MKRNTIGARAVNIAAMGAENSGTAAAQSVPLDVARMRWSATFPLKSFITGDVPAGTTATRMGAVHILVPEPRTEFIQAKDPVPPPEPNGAVKRKQGPVALGHGARWVGSVSTLA